MSFADFERALDKTNEIELTATGRTSGRESSRRLWFVRQGVLPQARCRRPSPAGHAT